MRFAVKVRLRGMKKINKFVEAPDVCSSCDGSVAVDAVKFIFQPDQGPFIH